MKMLTRKLDKTSRVKPTIAFYSRKNRSMMLCESRLEADALLQLEFNDNVLRYVTQPCSVTYHNHDTPRRYTPDVLVAYRDGTYRFLEIKPYSKAEKDKFTAKLLTLQSYFLEEIGHPLELVTDKEIRVGKSAVNLRLLYRFLDVSIDEETTKQVIQEAKALNKITVANVENLFANYGKDIACAWGLIANQKLKYNHKFLLNRASQLEVAA
jgi:hypothetical protein